MDAVSSKVQFSGWIRLVTPDSTGYLVSFTIGESFDQIYKRLNDRREYLGRLWTYQTCTEFGYYQTSTSSKEPFGNNFPLSFALQQCQDIFGPNIQFPASMINGSIAQTNQYYGGLNFMGIDVTVSKDGGVWLWTQICFYFVGTAHCANMYPPRPTDNPALQVTRDLITQNIAMWLKKY